MRNAPPGTPLSVTRLPIIMDDMRAIFRTLNIEQMSDDIKREASARLSIVGPVNAGKSTLFNMLEGKDVAEVGPIPGTTKIPQTRTIGPFVLVDTPGFGEVGGVDRASIAAKSAAESDAVLLLLDAGAGLRQGDADLLKYLQGMGKPVVVAMNKIDMLGRDYARVVEDASTRLDTRVIPISAKKGTNIAEKLVPALVDALPDLAVAMGRELPHLRRILANRVIKQSSILNTAAGAEPIPFIDIPILLTTQVRMVLRVAAIYGEPFQAKHARELIGTIGGGLAFRFLAQQSAKLVPVGGWAVAAGIAALGTWSIGQVAIEYFESGKRLTRAQMRQMHKNIMKRDRETFEKEVQV